MAIITHGDYNTQTWRNGQVITKTDFENISNAIKELYDVNFYGIDYIPNGGDLNEYIKTGRYIQNNKNRSFLNSPVASNVPFYLLVFRMSLNNNPTTSERIVQIIITFSEGKIYVRTKGNRKQDDIIGDDDWYDWHQIARIDDCFQDNLLPPIYYYETKYGKDFIKKGIRWIVNEDRSITAIQVDNPNTGERTSGNSSYFYITAANLEEIVPPLSLDTSISYTIDGCPIEANSNGETCVVQTWCHKINRPMTTTVIQNNEANWSLKAENVPGSPATFSIDSGKDNYVLIRLGIRPSFNFTSITFKPILVKGENTKNNFQVSNLVITKLFNFLNNQTRKIPKNLIPSKYHSEIKRGINHTHNGINWILNDDGSITAKGTANEVNKAGSGLNSYYYITSYSMRGNQEPIKVDNTKKYFLSGSPKIEGCSLRAYTIKQGKTFNINFNTDFGYSNYWDYYSDSGNGRTISNFSGDRIGIRIRIKYGTQLPPEGVTFYPMLVEEEPFYEYVPTHKSVNDNLDLIRASEIVETAKTYLSRTRKAATATKEEVLPNGLIYNTDNYHVFPRNYIKHTGTCYCSNFLAAVLMGLTYEQSPYGILRNIKYKYLPYGAEDNENNKIEITGADYRIMNIAWSSTVKNYLDWNNPKTPSDHTNYLTQEEALNDLAKAEALKAKLSTPEIMETLDDYKQYVGKKPWSFDLEKYRIYHASTICEWLTLAGTRLPFEPEEYQKPLVLSKPINTNYSTTEEYITALRAWRAENVKLARKLREAGVRKGDLLFTASNNDDEPDKAYLGMTHIVIITSDLPQYDQDPTASDFDDSLYRIILNCRSTKEGNFYSEVNDSNNQTIMELDNNGVLVAKQFLGFYKTRGVRYDYLTRICGTVKAICRPLTGDDAYGRYLEAAEAFTRNRTPDYVKENLLPFPYSSGPSTNGGVGTVQIYRTLADGTTASSGNQLTVQINQDGSITLPNPVPKGRFQFHLCRRQDCSVELKYNTRYNFKVIPFEKIKESGSSTFQGRFSVWRKGDFNKRDLDNSKMYNYERGRGYNYIKIPDFNFKKEDDENNPGHYNWVKEYIDTTQSSNKLYLDAYLEIYNSNNEPVDYSDMIFYPTFQEGYGIGAYQNPRTSDINIGRVLGILPLITPLEDVPDIYLPGFASWSRDDDPEEDYYDEHNTGEGDEEGGEENNEGEEDNDETGNESGEGNDESGDESGENNSGTMVLDQGRLDNNPVS